MSQVSYITQSHTNQAVRELETFLANEKYRSFKGCKYTNITDQVRGHPYCIPFNTSKINTLPCDMGGGGHADEDSLEPNATSVEHDESENAASEHAASENAASCSDSDEPPSTKMISAAAQRETVDWTDPDESGLLPFDEAFQNVGQSKTIHTPVDQFFEYLEAARRSGATLNYCEKQVFVVPSKTNLPYLKQADGTHALSQFDPETDALDIEEDDEEDVDIDVKRSCIMLDFDIYQAGEQRQLAETHCYSLAYSLIVLMAELFDFETMDNRTGKHMNMHIVFTVKPEPEPCTYGTNQECWKDGFHMYIYVKVSKPAKAFFISEILRRRILQNVLTNINVLNPINSLLDGASSYVPALFFGCAKHRKRPYEFYGLYEAQLDVVGGQNMPRVRKVSDMDPVPADHILRVRRGSKKVADIEPKAECKYNMCHELSLNFEVYRGLIKKDEVAINPKYREQMRIYNERRGDDKVSNAELQEIDYSINDLAVRNSQVRYLQKVLSLLASHRVSDYNDWKSVLIILARENPDYKPLAIWFSQRSAKQWVKGGLSALNKIWDWAVTHPATEDVNCRRIGTLIEWAKIDNPDEMRKASDQSTQITLIRYALENNGRLTDQNIADILKMMFRYKFVCDINPHAKNVQTGLEWYEFVLPTDNNGMEKEYIYKYRYEMRPDNLELYISTKFPQCVKNVSEWLDKKREECADDEAKQKYYAKVKANLAKTCESLGNAARATGILRKCSLVFRMRGFVRRLDTDPNVIGVGNGVLKLYPYTELIQRYHDNPVSRFTPVEFMQYDASNPYVKEIEGAIRDLFADEPDAHHFTMCYLASSLDARNKNPLIYLWIGEGSNGKSFLLELHINTLGLVVGGGYGAKMGIEFLTREGKTGGPNTEMMLLKHARFAYFSESEPGDYLRIGRVKELTGGENISAAEKFQKQDNFRVHCHFVVASNHDPRVTGSDHGTWRRILSYRFKMKFCTQPDPNNRYEKRVNRKFADTVNRDENYKRAYMSILVKYYEILRDKYNYDLEKIPKPSIDRDTQIYRNEQDTINRFIDERVIHVTPEENNNEPVDHISVHDLANRYIEWYRATIADIKLLTMDIAKTFNMSKLKKYLQKKHTGMYLTQHKVLGKNEQYDPEKKPTPEKPTGYTDEELQEIAADDSSADESSSSVDPKIRAKEKDTESAGFMAAREGPPEPSEMPSTESHGMSEMSDMPSEELRLAAELADLPDNMTDSESYENLDEEYEDDL